MFLREAHSIPLSVNIDWLGVGIMSGDSYLCIVVLNMLV